MTTCRIAGCNEDTADGFAAPQQHCDAHRCRGLTAKAKGTQDLKNRCKVSMNCGKVHLSYMDDEVPAVPAKMITLRCWKCTKEFSAEAGTPKAVAMAKAYTDARGVCKECQVKDHNNQQEGSGIVSNNEAPIQDKETEVTQEDEWLVKVEEVDFHILAGSGSRSLQNASPAGKIELMDWLEISLTDKRKVHPNLVVMSGMAEGFDKALATAALKLGIPLWVALPSGDYGAYYWGKKSLTGENKLAAFERYIAKATYVTQVMPDAKGSSKYNNKYGMANFDRNDFMVAQADEFLVYDPSSAGTSHCLKAIKAAGKPFTIVPIVK